MVCIDDEIPFEIPESWQWCRIKHLFSMQAGKNIKAFELSDTPTSSHTYPCYGGNGLRGYVNHYNTEGNFILVGRQGALCGNVKEVKGKFYATEHAVVTNGYGLTNLQWAYYFLWALDLNQYATATAQPGLAVSNIIEVLIPLPPFEEQIQIASKIDNTLLYVDSFTKAQKDLEVLNNEVILNLRKSILQEAIQGKLVPQDPNEESASVLLQRIKEEKQRQVKEDKLKKKDVTDSTIFKGDDNKYYEQIGGTILQIEVDYTFPETWEVAKLSHICRLMDGEKKEGKHICLDAKYLRGRSSGDFLPKGKFVSTGDNIILVDGENSGEVFSVPHDGYMGSTFKQLWVSKNMHLPYVLYFIQFYKDLLRNSKKGAAIPHLNKEIFYSLVVGIPPYQEQERIANAIRELYTRL
ncbi:MAG: restriction endonuclease subunit S [Aeriscardovia sp.]|nr:restriction endonuclease subunit S [Aeriscardovia sp.]